MTEHLLLKQAMSHKRKQFLMKTNQLACNWQMLSKHKGPFESFWQLSGEQRAPSVPPYTVQIKKKLPNSTEWRK